MTGSASSIAANRLSYVFDLHGPSMTIDTATSERIFTDWKNISRRRRSIAYFILESLSHEHRVRFGAAEAEYTHADDQWFIAKIEGLLADARFNRTADR
jgi:hypothetical protein